MCNIVIVEDESLERQALRCILTDQLAGCTILGEAATGREAMDLIDRNDIDLMLVDINIPSPNGLEVLQYLRQKKTDTKVIITTAHDRFDLAREAIRLKADEYLLKPVRPQTLIDTIHACLDIVPAQSQQLRRQIKRLSTLLTQNLYREGVRLVRNCINSSYAQKEIAPEQLLLSFADALAQLARDKALAPDEVQSAIQRLRAMPLDTRQRHKVTEALLDVLDSLFRAARDCFGHADDPTQKALNYIERNIDKGITLEETAENAHVSSCYLSRLFKKALAVNFVTYVTQRKMEMARELLQESEMTVNAISFELSYNDVNYFCKSFKRHVGMSPSEYRKRARTAT